MKNGLFTEILKGIGLDNTAVVQTAEVLVRSEGRIRCGKEGKGNVELLLIPQATLPCSKPRLEVC